MDPMVIDYSKLFKLSRKPNMYFKELICCFILITPLYFTYVVSYFYGYLSYKVTLISIYASFWNIAIILISTLLRKRVFVYAIYILLSILSLSEIFYISLFKTTINRSEFYVIYETYFNEIIEFLNDSLKIKTSFILVSAFYFGIFLGLIKTYSTVNRKTLRYLLLAVTCLMILTLSIKRARTEAVENNIAIKFIQSYISYSKSKEQFKSFASS